ncbi:hypothetical protein CPAV1605_1237 [seawater metagenome]|uniref:Uncharacterized protein n=1 Tax=seawater metagenome TaxID=1561972 RepID=A0A5E8CJX8_9ZZZZ
MTFDEEEFKMVFSSLMKNYGKEFLGIIFNFCLVLSNTRKAILLESSNHLFNHYHFSKFFEYLKPFIKKYNLKIFKDSSKPVRIYIYNQDIEEFEKNKEITNITKIGMILGYSCPGLMNASNIINFTVEGKSIFSEICCSPVPLSIYTKLNQLKKIGKVLNLNIDLNITKRISVELTIEFIKNKNYFKILRYKDEIANIFYNHSFNMTGDLFYKLKNINQVKKFILYDKRLILLILNYIQNNPYQHLYGKLEKDLWMIYDEKIEKIENEMYNIMKEN